MDNHALLAFVGPDRERIPGRPDDFPLQLSGLLRAPLIRRPGARSAGLALRLAGTGRGTAVFLVAVLLGGSRLTTLRRLPDFLRKAWHGHRAAQRERSRHW